MIQIDDTETIELLKSLIAIDSVNPDLQVNGAGEAEIAEFIQNYLAQAGLDVFVQEVKPGRSNIIGILRSQNKTPGKTLMLNGHTDTVGSIGMDIPPHEPVERNGLIYGRGSADMKSGVSAMLSAVTAVARAKVPLRGDVIVAAVVDEEYASIGTEALVKEYTADAAIVTEPTGLNITIAHKGFAWLDIHTTGKAAHGSDATSGKDAIMMMGTILQGLRSYEHDVLRTREHPLLSPPSLHASIIEGGKELSTYPDRCHLQVERRTIPGESMETVQHEVDSIISECRIQEPDLEAEANIFFYREPLEIERHSEIVRMLHEHIQITLNAAPVYDGSAGWMDSGILSSAGIPTVIFGPSGRGFHSAVEYVEKKSVLQCTRILTDTIVSFCS